MSDATPTTPPATHSPLPWHTGTGKAEIIVYDQNGWAVADAKVFHGRYGIVKAETNAAFIVTACNAHAKLVEALKTVQQLLALGYLATVPMDKNPMGFRDLIGSALAAAGEA